MNKHPKATVDQIDALLPQTQCQECGYAGCRPYAQALFNKATTIDKCPPGGVPTLTALAKLLQQDPKPYVDKISKQYRTPSLAIIYEDECIGCTKCIKACPVDAIVGTAKRMHTIISQECTGCGLCIPPCPMDCIGMLPLTQKQFKPNIARERYNARQQRIAQHQQPANNNSKKTAIKLEIAAAVARVKKKRQSTTITTTSSL